MVRYHPGKKGSFMDTIVSSKTRKLSGDSVARMAQLRRDLKERFPAPKTAEGREASRAVSFELDEFSAFDGRHPLLHVAEGGNQQTYEVFKGCRGLYQFSSRVITLHVKAGDGSARRILIYEDGRVSGHRHTR